MEKKMEVAFYKTQKGNEPVNKYFERFNDDEAGRILAVISDIEKNGLDGPGIDTRQIQGKLWELKIQQHRVFYTILDGPQMVLLHACKKQGKKARKEDISTAKRRLADLKT